TRRTYDSEFTAPLSLTTPGQPLVQGSEVRSQRRGLHPSRLQPPQTVEAIDLSGGLDCHQLHRHPHHTGYHGKPASQTAAVEYSRAASLRWLQQSRIAAAAGGGRSTPVLQQRTVLNPRCAFRCPAWQLPRATAMKMRKRPSGSRLQISQRRTANTANQSNSNSNPNPASVAAITSLASDGTLKEHGVLLEISDQDLARLPGGWSPLCSPSWTSPACRPVATPFTCRPPSAAAAVAPGGPGTAYCWNAAAAAHPGCTYGGYGSFQQQPVMMPHQCQHQLHQLQQQQQQQPYCGNVNWHCGIHANARRTQHVYESYNSEERDNDEDTACYHDAQSRLRPSRQQLLNSSRPTGGFSRWSPRSCGRRPVRELLSTRRRRTSSSSRMNRDEHSLQHHHYRTSASNCRPAGNSTSAAETPEQYGGTRRHLATRRHNVEAASGVTRCSSPPPHYRDHRSHPHHLHQHHHRLSANDELGDRAASAAAAAAADADEPTPTSAFLHYG
uniref:AXH domain-containing protein n=1 Tax=Macrostomum lignano TaxID=282301 RepID=A0A1I8F613_9PLAT